MSRTTAAAAAALSVLALGAAGFVAAEPATAADPISVGAGTETDGQDLDGKVGDGGCNVAAVGYDRFDNKVALTAGHCGDVGYKMLVGGKVVGTYATSTWGTDLGSGMNKLDYAFVKLDDDVVMEDDPASPVDVKSIVAPTTDQFPVCKYGHGLLNTGERCGLTTAITEKDFLTTILVTPFDSGSPVYVNRTQLVGIVSRLQPWPPGNVMTRADAAVADATKKNAVGAGFEPVA